jgi:lysophospholipase L1-like esterase
VKKRTLIALGDSITFGWPYEQEFSWVNTLQKNISQLSILNKGVSGDTFADMINRLEEEVLINDPDYSIVMGGANEAYQHIPLPVLKQNFLEIIRQLQENQCEVIIGNPTPVEDVSMERYLDDFRAWLINFCKENNFRLLDFHKLMLNEGNNKINNSLFIDGCHPNKNGYELMGKYALEKLLEWNIF